MLSCSVVLCESVNGIVDYLSVTETDISNIIEDLQLTVYATKWKVSTTIQEKTNVFTSCNHNQ